VNLTAMCSRARGKVHAIIDARAAAAKEEITLAFQRLRRARNLPPIALSSWKYAKLPARFQCPECGGRLIFEVNEWSTATGTPTPGGISVMCEAEEKELWSAMQQERDPEWQHRSWQSDWMPVVRQVERFCASRVRIYE